MTTLLQGVNEVLKKVSVIQGDTGAVTSLSDSAKQVWIDLAVQSWNEAIDQLYSISDKPKPNELAKASITLATGDRDYALNSAVVQLHWPLLDETNGRQIHEYPNGYMQMIKDQQFPASYTGVPYLGAIDPTNGELYLNAIPTSEENGLVYQYWYDKDLSLSAATDTFPFTDAVFRALVPVVADLWKLEREHEFNNDWSKLNLGS
jgi:hypothetical protein